MVELDVGNVPFFQGWRVLRGSAPDDVAAPVTTITVTQNTVLEALYFRSCTEREFVQAELAGVNFLAEDQLPAVLIEYDGTCDEVRIPRFEVYEDRLFNFADRLVSSGGGLTATEPLYVHEVDVVEVGCSWPFRNNLAGYILFSFADGTTQRVDGLIRACT